MIRLQESLHKTPIVRMLGNGGGLSYDMDNTNFTVLDYFLIDCGRSTYPKLVKEGLIDKLKYVFITHHHDDHIGSLSSFWYYKILIQKENPTVVVPEYLKDYTRNFVCTGIVKYPMFGRFTSPDDHGMIKAYGHTVQEKFTVKDFHRNEFLLTIKIIPVPYGGYGHIDARYSTLMVKFDFFGNGINFTLVFTGDIKPSKELVKIFEDCRNLDGLYIFHDLSLNPSVENIHPTIQEIDQLYPDKIKERLICVHTRLPNYRATWRLEDFMSNKPVRDIAYQMSFDYMKQIAKEAQ